MSEYTAYIMFYVKRDLSSGHSLVGPGWKNLSWSFPAKDDEGAKKEVSSFVSNPGEDKKPLLLCRVVERYDENWKK